MPEYDGQAYLELTDLRIAVRVALKSSIAPGGQIAWGGTFSGYDSPGPGMLLAAHEESDDVPLYLQVDDDITQVTVTEWNDRNGQMWDGRLLGSDDPPAALRP